MAFCDILPNGILSYLLIEERTRRWWHNTIYHWQIINSCIINTFSWVRTSLNNIQLIQQKSKGKKKKLIHRKKGSLFNYLAWKAKDQEFITLLNLPIFIILFKGYQANKGSIICLTGAAGCWLRRIKYKLKINILKRNYVTGKSFLEGRQTLPHLLSIHLYWLNFHWLSPKGCVHDNNWFTTPFNRILNLNYL